MKPFEIAWTAARPLLPPLYGVIRRVASEEITRLGARAAILDVGGRKSHYTIGLNADVTVTDLPRVTDVQRQLNLGVTDGMQLELRRRRSNVVAFLYEDMTKSALRDASFDLVLAVEVLEHVHEDDRFVREVCRVLRPGGAFIMSTPNGDFVENHNPDHVRHYSRGQLDTLLRGCFDEVAVWYAIAGGKSRELGLRAWSVRRPVRTILSMVGNVINHQRSARASLRCQAYDTHTLVAVGRKPQRA